MTKSGTGADPHQLLLHIQAGNAPLVIDVRSKREFEAGHVPGAAHVPFWQMAVAAARIPGRKDQPLVLYCGHGPRAYIAGAALRSAGFSRVQYLAGHMKRWRDLGLPLESSQ
jgi:rhodanese-related sulfurtransferase